MLPVIRVEPNGVRPARHPRGVAARTARRPRGWSPAVDVREEADRYVILAEVPGVDPATIAVKAERRVLAIEGERAGEADHGYLRAERASGRFERRFSLPDSVDTAGITASRRHGVLEIVMPKHASERVRRIDVT